MMSKIKLISLLLLLNYGSVSCQNSIKGVSLSEFEAHFKSLEKTLLIDDITVKYSNNKIISYSLIKKYIKDSSGKPLIKINDEKHHLFKAIGLKKINDSVSCYLFSHRANVSNDYYAYVAVFDKNSLTDFRGIYSNSEEDFGAIFIGNKYALFKANKSNFYEYYVVDGQGFIFEYEGKIKIDKIDFARETSYSINLNSKFFREKKVLFGINQINGKSTKQALRNIDKQNLILKQSFFIDSYMKDEAMELIYLNLLSSKKGMNYKKVYEVIKDEYSNNEWLKNIPLSEYFIMPNGKEIIKQYTLKR